ncbi:MULTISPECIES: homogentisate 1,2-dioxygenase [unclassified Spirosoma]|uniref:homogentisate 1,2-dioxygenase n=1 Tax=unclassified Spirosoma TaxID=2621999 RepID=UPI00096398BA|nr:MULTISPECIES: homogentisate 1,2-dioxygenase [unclassified Spirosoma]MBN8821770.1 homogentisate 1,2-dioxygenase [Spirosoma sp.]OJW80738.1 MAG: homogentisate 1,2-dioxygenase [Spirosoma sp. 48-14]
MPFYHTLGQIPPKRHTQFAKPDGQGLYYEQLFGTIGFEGMSSLLYHVHRPTMVREVLDSVDVTPKLAVAKNMLSRKLIGFTIEPADDFLESRTPLLVNNDLIFGLAAPRQSLTSYFYKNADSDELLFVHKGTGRLRTLLGTIPFQYGDYLIIPRGMIYQIEFDSDNNRLLYVESHSPIYTPKRYRNHFGQLLEHAPFCERDIVQPRDLETHDETGDFLIKIKKQGALHSLVYASHPFDVVGWDGYNYPYAFSILNFEPITGRVHQPPPVHQTFQTDSFVVCSFVPRLFDYHPLAIPAPYNHSNIDSDEVIYYVDGDFMSRNDIAQGHITLHPGGIPHGPAPGAMERSIGKTETQEYAVMVDTFRPLMLTEQALRIDDGKYYKSWLE